MGKRTNLKNGYTVYGQAHLISSVDQDLTSVRLSCLGEFISADFISSLSKLNKLSVYGKLNILPHFTTCFSVLLNFSILLNIGLPLTIKNNRYTNINFKTNETV